MDSPQSAVAEHQSFLQSGLQAFR